MDLISGISKTMGKRVTLKDKTFEVSIPESKILERIAKIAKQMNKDLATEHPLFIVVLNGAFLFAAELFKRLDFPCEITFIRVASYEGTSSTGKIRNLLGMDTNIAGRNVVIVEDIIDRGDTMVFLLDELHKKSPDSIKISSLLLKPKALLHDIHCDYTGFEVPNDFLVGYGLDYDELGRNLNDIYTLVPEEN